MVLPVNGWPLIAVIVKSPPVSAVTMLSGVFGVVTMVPVNVTFHAPVASAEAPERSVTSTDRSSLVVNGPPLATPISPHGVSTALSTPPTNGVATHVAPGPLTVMA